MCFRSKVARRLVSVFSVFSLLVASLPTAELYAQVQDDEAPEIRHTVVKEGVAGGIQSFDAVVFDNAEITSVVLYYRNPGQGEFKSVGMVFREKDDYRAFIPSDAGSEQTIEYYIEAQDVGENKAISGFPDLYQRKLVVPIETSPIVEDVPAVTTNLPEETADDSVKEAANKIAGSEQGAKKSNALWWVIGGVVAAGVVASLISDDDDDSVTPSDSTVTFTLTPP